MRSETSRAVQSFSSGRVGNVLVVTKKAKSAKPGDKPKGEPQAKERKLAPNPYGLTPVEIARRAAAVGGRVNILA
jgi:hypothetical protein